MFEVAISFFRHFRCAQRFFFLLLALLLFFLFLLLFFFQLLFLQLFGFFLLKALFLNLFLFFLLATLLILDGDLRIDLRRFDRFWLRFRDRLLFRDRRWLRVRDGVEEVMGPGSGLQAKRFR